MSDGKPPLILGGQGRSAEALTDAAWWILAMVGVAIAVVAVCS